MTTPINRDSKISIHALREEGDLQCHLYKII